MLPGQATNLLSCACYFLCTCRHESGEVKFWDVTTGAMRLIYKLKTANLFVGQESPSELLEDFADFKWPPYYKVSTFDPFEDDPRLAIKCVEFCPHSRTLCLGGNGGQVITFSLNPISSEISLEVSHRTYLRMCILQLEPKQSSHNEFLKLSFYIAGFTVSLCK